MQKPNPNDFHVNRLIDAKSKWARDAGPFLCRLKRNPSQ